MDKLSQNVRHRTPIMVLYVGYLNIGDNLLKVEQLRFKEMVSAENEKLPLIGK